MPDDENGRLEEVIVLNTVWAFVTTVLGLLAYSTWMTWNWTRTKGSAAFHEGESKSKQVSIDTLNQELVKLQKQYNQQQESYEQRIPAYKKQVADLEAKLLGRVSPISHIVLSADELQKDDSDSDK